MENGKYLAPEQICAGLYIHLDRGWLHHPFTFSSFLVKTQHQVEVLRKLGIGNIRYDPAKSTAQPLPVSTAPAATSAPEHVPVANSQLMAEKQARSAQLKRVRSEIAAVEKQFTQAADTVKNISRNVHTRPLEVRAEATTLVHGMVETLLVKSDVMLHAMSDQLGEEVYFHSLNVTVLSLILGRALKLDSVQLRELGLGALFHDIGKVDIPRSIVMKAEPLTKAEEVHIEQHTKYGVAIAKKLQLTTTATEIIAHHHECGDASGYPARMAGAAIPPLARLVQIVNTYDNLCNPVNAELGLTPAEALSKMFVALRSKFDAAHLQVFIRCLGVYPPGSIVQLSNDMTGLVLSENSSQPLRPNVLVYDPEIPQDEAIIVSMEHEPELKIVRSLRPAQLPAEIYRYLSPRKRVTYYFDARQNQTR